MVAHMMTPGVVQIPGDVSVSEAALLLEREQAPCLLIKDTDTQFGLMTPTDIVKNVVAQGLEPHDIEVRTIMTRPVQFIEYDEAMDRGIDTHDGHRCFSLDCHQATPTGRGAQRTRPDAQPAQTEHENPRRGQCRRASLGTGTQL